MDKRPTELAARISTKSNIKLINIQIIRVAKIKWLYRKSRTFNENKAMTFFPIVSFNNVSL